MSESHKENQQEISSEAWLESQRVAMEHHTGNGTGNGEIGGLGRVQTRDVDAEAADDPARHRLEDCKDEGEDESDSTPYPEEVVAQLELSADATAIAETLQEPMIWMIQNAIDVMGLTVVREVVEQTLTIEAEGGMWTTGRERRRTAGGVFFKLLKDRADRTACKRIFEPPQPIREYLHTVRPKGPAHPPPLTPLPWSKVRAVVNKLLEQPMEKCIVRITLMGRPSQVSKTKSCVVVALKGQRPPSLPKGLPPVPEDSEYSFAVFIAHKHWSRVAPVMAQDANAKLIIEGYPVFDAKRGVTIVLAQHTRVTSSGFRHRQAVNFR